MSTQIKSNLTLLLLVFIVLAACIPALISFARDGYGSGGAVFVQLSAVSNKLTYNMVMPFDFNYKLLPSTISK